MVEERKKASLAKKLAEPSEVDVAPTGDEADFDDLMSALGTEKEKVLIVRCLVVFS